MAARFKTFTAGSVLTASEVNTYLAKQAVINCDSSSDYPSAPVVGMTVYDLPGLPKIHEHDGNPAQGFGVVRNGRLVIFYSWSSDIGDGLEDPGVHGDPADVRESAARMAVNVLTYALTRP